MPINPYKRLRELTLTSQKDFAAKYGFSKTMMSFIESGQAVDLSERQIVSLGQECHEKGVSARAVLDEEYGGVDHLQDAYQNWKSLERMQNAHRFQVTLSADATGKTSPFEQFILDVAGSQQKFCKLLKVPAASVHTYATGKTHTLPKAVEEALIQVRFPYLPELVQLQTEWIGARS